MHIFSRYRGVGEVISRYWYAYGGWKEVLVSPYFHLALVINILTISQWTGDNWHSPIINIMPSLLGFSLGGYAILLSFGNDQFLERLTKPSKNYLKNKPKDIFKMDSIYIKVNASFVHFIVLQMIALLLALIYQSGAFSHLALDSKNMFLTYWPDYPAFLDTVKHSYSFTTYLIFIYALLSAISLTFNIFRMAGWFNLIQLKKHSKSPHYMRDKLLARKSNSQIL
ncbi:hypothetical protein [Candidatus Thiodiazotropha sp. CDECU1]|uniref:hypothetical protein n=1 Tax=Candidatus Thiodiazotropha sp. CDECU1 TaxID=3065865 RepID=UPI00292F57E5|nr:hypothetical protein [Candidatus Thiodiazotropha sp. CDECU1]